jgi:heat shock protein HtpX
MRRFLMGTSQVLNKQETEKICPECKSNIPVHKGYISWCECGYNVKINYFERPQTKLNKLYDQLGDKRGKRIYKKLIAKKELVSEVTFSKVLVFLLATLIHLVSIISLSLGSYLLTFHNSNYLLIACGLGLLGISWLARPRAPKLEKTEHLISREEFPYLFSAADQLADAMKVRRIDGIVINEDFNASVTQIGWTKRNIIKIGYPLFSLLEPEEQMAILAHEFGHIKNGDLTRSFYIGSALFTIQTWYELLEPVPLDERENMGIAELPVYYLMALISQIPYLFYFLLVHFLYDDAQKGEYLADERSAKTVGYHHLIEAMKKFEYAETFYSTVRDVALKQNKLNLFHVMYERIITMPLREKERLWRCSQMESAKLDATHPPTYYRVQMLEKFSAMPYSPAVDKEVLSKIRGELDSQQKRIQEQLIENYRYELNY